MSIKYGIDYYNMILSEGDTAPLTSDDMRWMQQAARDGHIRAALVPMTTAQAAMVEARIKVLKYFHYVLRTASNSAFPDTRELYKFLFTGNHDELIANCGGGSSFIVNLCIQSSKWRREETDIARLVRQSLGYVVHAAAGAALYESEIITRTRQIEALIYNDARQYSFEDRGTTGDDDEEGERYSEDDEDSDDDGLLNYSANPFDYHPWDKRNADNALVFGVELEMEATGNARNGARTLVGKLGGNRGGTDRHFILKSDGSLTEGVELVTMPLTLEQHKDPEGNMPWSKVLSPLLAKDLAKSGADTTHCGIHVHINKKALSALTIGKMLVFLNSDTLAPLVSLIAQRASSHYCKRDGKKKIVDGGAQRGADRYDIMNISVNHPTCEIRMFRGNLRPERILKNIEFCHALVQYCRQTSMQGLTDWGNFTRWLLSHRGVYDNLVQFLIDKNAVGFRQEKRESNEFHTYKVLEEV